MVNVILEEGPTIIDINILEPNSKRGCLQKERVALKANINNFNDIEWIDNRDEVEPIDFKVVKWPPSRPFDEDEVVIEVKKVRLVKVQSGLWR